MQSDLSLFRADVRLKDITNIKGEETSNKCHIFCIMKKILTTVRQLTNISLLSNGSFFDTFMLAWYTYMYALFVYHTKIIITLPFIEFFSCWFFFVKEDNMQGVSFNQDFFSKTEKVLLNFGKKKCF